MTTFCLRTSCLNTNIILSCPMLFCLVLFCQILTFCRSIGQELWLIDNLKTLYTNRVYELNPLLLVLSLHFDIITVYNCIFCYDRSASMRRIIWTIGTTARGVFISACWKSIWRNLHLLIGLNGLPYRMKLESLYWLCIRVCTVC
jgi:hypothetical protein